MTFLTDVVVKHISLSNRLSKHESVFEAVEIPVSVSYQTKRSLVALCVRTSSYGGDEPW